LEVDRDSGVNGNFGVVMDRSEEESADGSLDSGFGIEKPGKVSKLCVSISESSSLKMSCEYLVRENKDAREKLESAGHVVKKQFSSKITSLVIWIFLREGMSMR
jgi:uncharacterized phage infection (PIP) family protein YhgE